MAMKKENIKLSKAEIEQMIEDASEKAAKKVLTNVGLGDEYAMKDVKDLRSLLKALKAAKKDALRLFIKWVISVILILITAGFISLLSDHNIK